MNNTGVTFLTAKKRLWACAWAVRNSAYAVNLTYDRHMHIYIYHAKSRLNTPVWGSLRSPKYHDWMSFRQKMYSGKMKYIRYFTGICLTTWNITYRREISLDDVKYHLPTWKKWYSSPVVAMVLICYSTGSRKILGYIPLFFGRAAK